MTSVLLEENIIINIQIVSGPAQIRSWSRRSRAGEEEEKEGKGCVEWNDCLGMWCGPAAMNWAARYPSAVLLSLILKGHRLYHWLYSTSNFIFISISVPLGIFFWSIYDSHVTYVLIVNTPINRLSIHSSVPLGLYNKLWEMYDTQYVLRTIYR